MNPPSREAADATRADQATAFQALQESAKGQLMFLLAGRPLSITATQVIFALPVDASGGRSQEDYLKACEELLAEGAINHYVFVSHTTRYRADNGNIEPFATSLDTPVVIAVRRRSAESTRIGPAAL